MTNEEVMELHDAIIKQDEELRKQVNFPKVLVVGSGLPCSCAPLAVWLPSMHGGSDALAFQHCVDIHAAILSVSA